MQIDWLLEKGLQCPFALGSLPHANVKRVTYRREGLRPESDPVVQQGLGSTVLIQFTPNSGDDMAMVRIWNDDNLEPIFERTWKNRKQVKVS